MSTGPAHRVQSAVEVYGYPQGHLGHLTTEEEEALKNFKLVCADKGLYTPGSTEEEPGTHDDATLLRFLRARRFVVSDALQQFADTEAWRKINQLDTLYETIDLEQYDETRRLYPQWTGRRDKRGIPVYVFEVKHLNAKTMAAYEKSAGHTHHKAQTDGKTPGKLLRLFALYENLVRFVMPLSTVLTDREYPRTPITQSNNIVDISGVGLKQFWNLRIHMQDASTLATAHYPETLDRIFIIGAPAFFPTVWGWIKRWFDPITTSKIFILSHHEMQSTLRSFIDPANIPKKYGGELDFEFGQMPTLDPALKDVVTWENGYTEFPVGPLYWVDIGDYIELKAAGSVDKKDREETICKIKKTVHGNDVSEKATGAAITGALRPELLSVPTAKDEVPLAAKEIPLLATNGESTAALAAAETPLVHPKPEPTTSASTEVPVPVSEAKVVQGGEVVPASRPEPVTFVSAVENLQTLSLNEKMAEPAVNGIATGPHKTLAANLLDPAIVPAGSATVASA